MFFRSLVMSLTARKKKPEVCAQIRQSFSAWQTCCKWKSHHVTGFTAAFFLTLPELFKQWVHEKDGEESKDVNIDFKGAQCSWPTFCKKGKQGFMGLGSMFPTPSLNSHTSFRQTHLIWILFSNSVWMGQFCGARLHLTTLWHKLNKLKTNNPETKA
jgi:hypothetical protein